MQREHRQVTKHNEHVLKILQKGDIIRIPRRIYDHFAIYIDDGYVVHFGKDEKFKCYVKMDDFFEVCMNSKAEIFNYLDGKISPLDSNNIVAQAESMIGKSGYNLLTNNCEHLATFCRYGIKHSQQVLTGTENILLAIIMIVIILMAILIAQCLHGMCQKEEDLFIDCQDLFHPFFPDRLFMSAYQC